MTGDGEEVWLAAATRRGGVLTGRQEEMGGGAPRGGSC